MKRMISDRRPYLVLVGDHGGPWMGLYWKDNTLSEVMWELYSPMGTCVGSGARTKLPEDRDPHSSMMGILKVAMTRRVKNMYKKAPKPAAKKVAKKKRKR